MNKPVTLVLIILLSLASFAFAPGLVRADIWSDNFDDGNYDGWTIHSGTWAVVNGELHGSGSFSPIYTVATFTSDRIVESELRSVYTQYVYDVAVLMIKWVNIENQITTRLFTDGNVELIMWMGGNKVWNNLYYFPDLDPYQPHAFRAEVAGTNIKVYVDYSLRIDANSDFFDDIAGAVGYQTGPASFFDDMIVTYSSSPPPPPSNTGLIAYAYDNYGRQVTATVYIDGWAKGTTNNGVVYPLSFGYHEVTVSDPSGNTFYRFISNNLMGYQNQVEYPLYSKPVSVFVNTMMTITAYYTTSSPPQPTGYDYNNGGRASVLFSTDWIMQPLDLAKADYAFSQIYGYFNAHQNVYRHLQNCRSQTTAYRVITQIQDCENDQHHNWATFFYYGHMGIRQLPNYPSLWSYGFHVQANPYDQNTPPTLWDTDQIYPYTAGNFHFVFLWVCNNGNPAPPPEGGSSSPVVHGPPYCWTRYAGLRFNAYSNPDNSDYCFIGFQGASPTLMESMGVYYGGELSTYQTWLIKFYQYASQGYSISYTLDRASREVGYTYGWLDGSNRLSQGWDYQWFGGAGQNPGTYRGQMRVYGDPTINLLTG